jgi:RNA polymerase sigma-70 factor (ECF subfamily)
MDQDSKPFLDALPGREGNPPGAKLSSDEGVRNDMSSLAINGPYPSGAGVSTSGALHYADAAKAESMTDAEIMLQVKSGDDSAFNYLIEKYRRAIISFMYRMVHNSAVAEELCAGSLPARVSLARKLHRRCEVHHVAVSHRDQPGGQPRARYQARTSGDEEEPGRARRRYGARAWTWPTAGSTWSSSCFAASGMIAIRKQVESLPERQRMAVLMHKYQNMDYKQIAEVLHLSESATKSLLFRAYETLRDKLKDFV